MKVAIYSDIACPWCYIGKRRFERALADFPGREEIEVVFRPFQLDPHAPETAEPMLPNLERKFGPRTREMVRHVSELAKREGLEFDYERGLAVNTFTAHRLLWLAEHDYGPEVQRALGDALFAAHFERGGDVGDAAQLTELARQVGMDRERVASFLASDEGSAEVRAEMSQAHALGITAVPTFVFDEQYAVSGAQPTSLFLQALEQVRSVGT